MSTPIRLPIAAKESTAPSIAMAKPSVSDSSPVARVSAMSWAVHYSLLQNPSPPPSNAEMVLATSSAQTRLLVSVSLSLGAEGQSP